MSVTGHLRTMAAGHLFQWLSFSQKTGRLVIRSTVVEKTVFVKKGKIVFSASTDPREYLGQFLMSHGYIGEDELKKAMEVQEQSKILLGKILVIIEAITEEDLKRLMKRKAEEEIYDVFLWSDGDFEFQDDEAPAMELVPLNVDITGIIMEGSRRVDEWDHIRQVVTSTDLIPVREGEIDPAGLQEAQRKIVELVDGHRTIAEIVLESRSSQFVVSRTICDLAAAGKMGLAERPKGAAKAAEPVPVASERSTGDDTEVASLLSRAQKCLKQREYDKALRMLKAAQNLDPEGAKVRSALKGAEAVILSEIRKSGITDQKIPELKMPMEEVSEMNFAPNEGFILSRITGQWDVGSIMKVSPMREIEALMIFHKLVTDGVINLR